MRQRLGIAESLLNKPNVLILDEPTNGLDPEGIKNLRDLLKKLANDGMGILISSHNLAELESFCNKVCVIDSGNIIENTQVKDFKSTDSEVLFTVSSTCNLNIKTAYGITKNQFLVKANNDEISQIIKELVAQNIAIYEVKKQELSLEEAFLKKTGGNKNAKIN
jgi:ABC-2 type transport system ATP-binding protein